MWTRHPQFGEPWGRCDFCGFDVPVSRLTRTKYGWQCTGWPGADCHDARPDYDDQRAAYRPRTNEGLRRSKAPTTDPDEGIDRDRPEERGWPDWIFRA